MLLTLNGEGVLKLPKRDFRLLPGTVAVIAPNTPMEYFVADSILEFYWINIYGHATEGIIRLITDWNDSAIFQKRNQKAEDIICELIELNNENKTSFEIEASEKIAQLLHITAKELLVRGKKESTTMAIISYLERNYINNITFNMLSKEFYISTNQIIRNFKKETGFTPYEYLKRYRLSKACELLQMTDKTVEEIGSATGFFNVSNFIHQFKEMYGITPLRYRKHFAPVVTK